MHPSVVQEVRQRQQLESDLANELRLVQRCFNPVQRIATQCFAVATQCTVLHRSSIPCNKSTPEHVSSCPTCQNRVHHCRSSLKATRQCCDAARHVAANGNALQLGAVKTRGAALQQVRTELADLRKRDERAAEECAALATQVADVREVRASICVGARGVCVLCVLVRVWC